MKSFLNSLRIFIAAGSVAGFVGGWALLAHAGKPVDAAAPAPVIQSAPVLQPSQNFTAPQRLQPLPSFTQPNFSVAPRLRTGGS